MTNISIRQCTIAEIEQADTLQGLLEDYGRESAVCELGAPAPSWPIYYKMEECGGLAAIGAFSPEGLVGMALILIYGLPHYSGRCVAAMESLFVSPKYRRGGTGMKLLKEAEQHSASRGAIALLVSAPEGSRLAEVLGRTSGYRCSNRIFTKALQ